MKKVASFAFEVLHGAGLDNRKVTICLCFVRPDSHTRLPWAFAVANFSSSWKQRKK